MNQRTLPSDDRLLDLLAQQATEGLDAAEAAELQAALDAVDQRRTETEGLALAAAALEVGAIEAQGETEPMPEALAASLISRGRQVVAETDRRPGVDDEPPRLARADDHDGWKLFSVAGLGWLTAAAAIVVAIVTIFVSAGPDAQRQAPPPVARERLMQTADDLVRVEWTQTRPEFADVQGDVVWSDSRQTGYMRFTGMPVNDPRQQQYQLWIVDPDRDEQPIDGGVFDVNEQGEVIIPINAKLPVDDPAAFAITVEKPGGVVVSEGPLQVVAPVAG